MSIDNPALADGPQREGFVAHDFSSPIVSRSAQLLSHAMTMLETNHDAWCCLDAALTLLRGLLQESPANAASAAGVRQGGLARRQSRAAIEYINANFASKLTLAEIAKVVCLSKSHFSRAFKSTHGVSPSAYIIMARVERAKRMIRATREPLSQIASACGFADQAHLCKAFRRWVGVSPGIYRRAVSLLGDELPQLHELTHSSTGRSGADESEGN